MEKCFLGRSSGDGLHRCASVASKASGTLLASSSWVGLPSCDALIHPRHRRERGFVGRASEAVAPPALARFAPCLASTQEAAAPEDMRESGLCAQLPCPVPSRRERESVSCPRPALLVPWPWFLGTKGASQGHGVSALFCKAP